MTNDKMIGGTGTRSSGGSSLTQQLDCALRFSNLLNDNQLSESDLSLLSWLRSIPGQTFSCPFQRRSLRVDIEPLPKPQKTLMNVSIMDSASDLLSRYAPFYDKTASSLSFLTYLYFCGNCIKMCYFFIGAWPAQVFI